jgi:hypothetical protein
MPPIGVLELILPVSFSTDYSQCLVQHLRARHCFRNRRSGLLLGVTSSTSMVCSSRYS